MPAKLLVEHGAIEDRKYEIVPREKTRRGPQAPRRDPPQAPAELPRTSQLFHIVEVDRLGNRKILTKPTSKTPLQRPSHRAILFVCVRSTLLTGSCATPWPSASRSVRPTCASGGSVNKQYGTRRSRVVRLPPARLSLIIRKLHNPKAAPAARISRAQARDA
jgi:hypothetical protein